MVDSAPVVEGSDLVMRVADVGVDVLSRHHHAVVDVVLGLATDAGVECQVPLGKRSVMAFSWASFRRHNVLQNFLHLKRECKAQPRCKRNRVSMMSCVPKRCCLPSGKNMMDKVTSMLLV